MTTTPTPCPWTSRDECAMADERSGGWGEPCAQHRREQPPEAAEEPVGSPIRDGRPLRLASQDPQELVRLVLDAAAATFDPDDLGGPAAHGVVLALESMLSAEEMAAELLLREAVAAARAERASRAL